MTDADFAPTTIDAQEVAKFEAISAEWWDPDGKFKPLHLMNPCRLDYILNQIVGQFGTQPGRSALAGLSVVDVGSGGGLIAEPMARLGAKVTGLEAAVGNVAVASAHAATMGLTIDYQVRTAEAAAADGDQFDVVLALEIVEHVADVPSFIEALATLVRPGGLLIMSTLSRTAKSWVGAIVGAERILRWLPVGTHDWNKFLTPEELEAAIAVAGLEVVDCKGMVLNPVSRDWALSDTDLSMNYILTAEKA